MTYRRLSICAALLGVAALGVAGCSGGHSTTSSSATQPNAVHSTSANASSVSTAAAAPAASALAAADVSGGGATDFCSAINEFKTAREADTPQAVGAGFRAAAADIRKYAPAEIKAAAGLYADTMDEVGKQIAAGGANPELIGSGQSAERRQGIADSITWVTKNCH